jgi:hypothetical protein
MKSATLSVLTVAMLAACGGGGGNGGSGGATNGGVTTSGVAAVGAPIIGGTVDLKCSSGATASAMTNATGNWSVTLQTSDYPCVTRVSGGKANGIDLASPLHSVAQTAGTTNITPLTDLVVGILAGQSPSTWYDSAKSGDLGSAITANGMSTALDKLKVTLATLPGKPALPNGFNPLTSTFSAEKGNAGDDLLESYGSALTAAGLTQTAAASQVAAGQPLTQSADSMKGFSPPKLTAVFAGSAKLQSGKTAIVVNDQHTEADIDGNGNITALASGSSFTGYVSLFGNTLGQLCMSGAGSNDPTMHSQYLFVSTDAGWTEVTDVSELFGKTFTEYEDCGTYHTVTFSANGDQTSTSIQSGISDTPTPETTVRAVYSSQGYTKDANGHYAIAKAYKRTENGVITYAYLFNGSDEAASGDYAVLGVSQ